MNLKAIPIMLSMIPSVANGVSLKDLEKIKAITRAAFPSVKQVSAKTLAEWQATSNQSILLVDVRSPKEFAVSHLHGALNLGNAVEIARAISEQRPSRTVLYCSVGFRSSHLAHKLANETANQVFNLEGSIFEWANEGRPVYQNQTEVRQVHPYGKRWAGLLTPGLASHCG